MKETLTFSPQKLLLSIFMGLIALIFFIPLIWMVRTAFAPQSEALNLFAVFVPTFDNIISIWNQAPFDQYYLNTLFMVGGTLVVQFFSITLAGYAFARLNFYGKNILFVLFLAQLMISADVLIMPNYRLMGTLDLIDTRIGVILPFFVSAMGILMMRQTIKTIPYELEEAAKMDGSGQTRTLISIYIPLLRPAYIAFGLISASYQWNNFLWPLVMINSEKNRPLTLGLAIFAMSSETGAQWGAVCAATLLVITPLLLIFLIFQRQFIESFAHSGIK